jgi:transcription elongation factor GreA
VSVPSTVSDPYAITQDGYQRLSEELRELRTTRLASAADAVRQSREDSGDVVDNAELAHALDDRTRLARRIDELDSILACARVVPPATDGTASIGTRIQVQQAGGPRVDYYLVGALESDARNQRVSIASPVGKALLGHSAGDIVEVQAPAGTRRLEILEVERPRHGSIAA